MELPKLVDLVLQELVSTMQPSISVRRILKNKKIGYTSELISEIEDVLKSKSLVDEKDRDSEGYACYSLTVTGQDFLRSFGSYSKYLKGIEAENRRVERARKKQPYQTPKSLDGQAPAPYAPKQKSFIEQNKFSLFFLFAVFLLFFLALNMK